MVSQASLSPDPKPFDRSGRHGHLAALIIALLALTPVAAGAAPGDLDGSFGGDGVSQLGDDTRLLGAAVQADGRLVAAGIQGEQADSARLLVVRFNPTGGLDSSFSGDGIFTGETGTVAHDVAVQPNGRIVVAGALSDPTGQVPAGMLVLRLNANGSPDPSFSGDGTATAFTGQRGQALAIAFDGARLVAAGSARPTDGFERVALARFNANGSPDGSFGSGGAVLQDLGRLSVANDVLVQPNRRILIAGSVRDNLQTTEVLAARFTAGGSIDGSFGAGGTFVRQYAQGAGYSAAFALALAGGKPVLGGSAIVAGQGATAIAVRLSAGGSADGSFSGDGVAYLPASTSQDQFEQQPPLPGAQALTLSGNTVLLGGYFDDFGLKRPAAWALRPNGTLDNSFGSGGRRVVAVDGGQFADLVADAGFLYGVGNTSGFFDPTRGLAARMQGLGPGGAPAGPRCFGKPATTVGTARSERIVGTPGRDVIVGFGGRDRIIGGDGNDLICGYRGNDSIASGGGRDLVSGGPGNDIIVTKRGPDRVFGNRGNDRIFLGPQRDRTFGNPGGDRIFGGDGPDVLYGNAGPDVLFGNRGDDKLFGNVGNDKLFGNRGEDLLNGDGGFDRVRQ